MYYCLRCFTGRFGTVVHYLYNHWFNQVFSSPRYHYKVYTESRVPLVLSCGTEYMLCMGVTVTGADAGVGALYLCLVWVAVGGSGRTEAACPRNAHLAARCRLVVVAPLCHLGWSH